MLSLIKCYNFFFTIGNFDWLIGWFIGRTIFKFHNPPKYCNLNNIYFDVMLFDNIYVATYTR